jgi:hypothetical protein
MKQRNEQQQQGANRDSSMKNDRSTEDQGDVTNRSDMGQASDQTASDEDMPM